MIRLCMFPLVIKAQRMTANMTNHMPTIQKLQLKFTQARQRGNMLEGKNNYFFSTMELPDWLSNILSGTCTKRVYWF